MDFREAVLPHLRIAFERQNYLFNLLGEDHQFTFSMDTGKITFNNRLSFKAQILGTESHYDESWLWGWANDASNIPPPLLQAGNKIKDDGQKYQIDLLIQSQFNLDEFHNGHLIGMFSSGLFRANAYYSIPYEGGALFVLIKDTTFPANSTDPLQNIAMTFPQLISNLTVHNHRLAFEYYAKAHDISISSQSAETITLQGKHNQTLTAQFDSSNRLTGLQGKLNN